jgi:hypothetical protein
MGLRRLLNRQPAEEDPLERFAEIGREHPAPPFAGNAERRGTCLRGLPAAGDAR